VEGRFVLRLWALADKVKGSRGQDRCDLSGHLASPSTQSADLPNGAFDLCLLRLWAFFSSVQFSLVFFYLFWLRLILSLSLSLSLTHTHTHTHYLSLSHTHTHT